MCGCYARVWLCCVRVVCVRVRFELHTCNWTDGDAPPPRPLQALETALSVYRVWPTTQYVRAPIEVMTPFLLARVHCSKVKGDMQAPDRMHSASSFFCVVVTLVSMQHITLTSHQQMHPSRAGKVQESFCLSILV